MQAPGGFWVLENPQWLLWFQGACRATHRPGSACRLEGVGPVVWGPADLGQGPGGGKGVSLGTVQWWEGGEQSGKGAV